MTCFSSIGTIAEKLWDLKIRAEASSGLTVLIQLIVVSLKQIKEEEGGEGKGRGGKRERRLREVVKGWWSRMGEL